MRPPRVLLVDDDPGLLQALPETLSLRIPNIVVEPVLSAQTALERLYARAYDTLVTDLRMPDMDGFTLLQAARLAQPHLPVVMMTGEANPAVVTQAFQAGAHDVLGKPFDRHEFAKVVRLALQTRRLRRDVKAQRFVLARFTARLRELDRVPSGSTPAGAGGATLRISDPTTPDAWARAHKLNQQAILSSRTSPEILKQRARLIEAILAQTDARLAAAQEEARRHALLRLYDSGEWSTFT
ncbi:response regulator [Candidatus Nitrospira bockiana]